MLETLKETILDSQELELKTGTTRHLNIQTVPGKASVFIGVRRSGKSTSMFQQMQRLIDSGVPRQNILYINFFDDRLHDLQRQGPGPVMEAYYSLYPEKKNTETCHCFFDEIQDVQGWEPFVDRLLRTENCTVHITGSSARMLSKEIATQMRGRSLSWEIFPFSFKEFLDFKQIEYAAEMSARRRLLVQQAFDEFRASGGFPEVAGVERHLRTKIHQEYFNAILFRDLVERHDISHPRMLSDLARRLVDNTSSMYSANSLTGYLKSLGHQATKAVVADYLEWLEDAYFLFTVRIFDASLARVNTNPKKIYCVDHALVRSVASGVLVNSGHLLENLVFTALRRTTSDISYYRTKGGREVDFVVQRPEHELMLVQVCESMADPITRARETTALTEAMKELNLTEGTIVTLGETSETTTASGTFHVIPAWKFLLSLEE